MFICLLYLAFLILLFVQAGRGPHVWSESGLVFRRLSSSESTRFVITHSSFCGFQFEQPLSLFPSHSYQRHNCSKVFIKWPVWLRSKWGVCDSFTTNPSMNSLIYLRRATCAWSCVVLDRLKENVLPADSVQLSSVQSLSCVRLFATPWTVALQASLSIINSQSLPKLMSTESVMPSNPAN